MTIGQLVHETIIMQKALRCDHVWDRPLNNDKQEVQCSRCSIIATPEGIQNLARMAAKL